MKTRIWPRLILGLAAIVVLIWLLARLSGFALSVLRAFRDEGEIDPMFAVVETPLPAPETPPPEAPVVPKDNSAQWDNSVQTPVDRTAEELQSEAFGTASEGAF